MFFSKPGVYKPCGMFTLGHLMLAIITITLIVVALKKTVHKSKEEIKNIIKKCIIILWVLEVGRIVYNLIIGNGLYLNEWLPLYYCSLLLYAGTFSAFAKGKLKRIGDVFIATGGIVGGVVFMCLPTTTLTQYPFFHFLSIHSFIYHGTMVYLGLLVNLTNYIELSPHDIVYFATLVGSICVVAYSVNSLFDTNLMFISKNFPGTPIEIIYNLTGPLFTCVMELTQMTLPFYGVYEIKKFIDNKKNKDLDHKILEEAKVRI